MKRLSQIVLSALVGILLGCSQVDVVPQPQDKGSLRVVISASQPTRAVSPGDGNIYDGGGMEDLTLLLVNPMGEISEIQRLTQLSAEEQRVKEVTFINLDVGNYMLYAYANTERTLLSEARTMLSSLRVGDSFNESKYNALFNTLTNRATPVMNDTNPMLLTAAKSVSVGVENASVSVDLLRTLVWLEVTLYNHSNHAMTITDVSFSNFNPSTSYILPKDGAIPASVTYRGLPLYDTFSGGEDVVVESQSEGCIYQTALFENRAPSYTMSLSATVGANNYTDATAISTSKTFAMKNRSTGSYLIDNGNGVLAVVSSLDQAPSTNHALWRFSSTSSGYITNVATGNRFYRSTSSASSGSNLTFTMSSGYLRLNYKSGSRTYYLRDNNGSLSYANNVTNQTRDWRLQELSQSSVSMQNQQIKVVNMQTAAVTPMSEQLRNQHISIEVNAYYNETNGSFNFTVVPWEEKSEEVEFN